MKARNIDIKIPNFTLQKGIPIVSQFTKIEEHMERTNGYTDHIFKRKKYKLKT